VYIFLFFFVVLGIGPRGIGILDKHSTTELFPAHSWFRLLWLFRYFVFPGHSHSYLLISINKTDFLQCWFGSTPFSVVRILSLIHEPTFIHSLVQIFTSLSSLFWFPCINFSLRLHIPCFWCCRKWYFSLLTYRNKGNLYVLCSESLLSPLMTSLTYFVDYLWDHLWSCH
jgi:hypothetical protein